MAVAHARVSLDCVGVITCACASMCMRMSVLCMSMWQRCSSFTRAANLPYVFLKKDAVRCFSV